MVPVVIKNPLPTLTHSSFPENLGAVCEVQSGRFDQGIAKMEQRCRGKWDSAMMGDYCWFI
jgi:hypothetical protein